MISYFWGVAPLWIKGMIGLYSMAILGLVVGFIQSRNPFTLVPVLIMAIAGFAASSVFGGPMMESYRSHVAETQGVAAQALIENVEDTGNRINYNPEVKMTLKIMPKGQAPVEVTIKRVISTVSVGEYHPGVMLNVIYIPSHPSWIKIK